MQKFEFHSLISVVVPVYNVELYLRRCIDSILRQTYNNIEIILVDDGSTDRSGEICDEYATLDRRVKVIHKKNGGLSSARNAGLDYATGELLGFVDSDDYISDNMYEKLYNLIIKYKANIACCNIESKGKSGHIGYKSENLEEEIVFSREESYFLLAKQEKIGFSVCNKLYRRCDFYNDYRFLKMQHEDVDAMVKNLSNINRLVYIGEPLYVYWYNPNSITKHGFSEGRFDELRSKSMIIPIYEKVCPQGIPYIKKSYIMTCIYILRKTYANKDFSAKRKEFYIYLKNYINNNPGLPYTNKEKWKIAMLKGGLPLINIISAIYDCYEKVKLIAT